MNKQPIGVFDSGVGGITVLEKLQKVLPKENYVYIADKGNCPYGIKTKEELINVLTKVVNKIKTFNIKALVIACNTASLYVDYIKTLIDVPVISMIDITSIYAYNLSKNKKIGVMATNMTINAHAYQDKLRSLNALVYENPCSYLVDFIEEGNLEDLRHQELARRACLLFKQHQCDVVIYGCTHFSLMDKYFKEVYNDCIYCDCGTPSSIALVDELTKNDLLNKQQMHGYLKLYTTGKVEDLEHNMKLFNLKYENILHLDL